MIRKREKSSRVSLDRVDYMESKLGQKNNKKVFLYLFEYFKILVSSKYSETNRYSCLFIKNYIMDVGNKNKYHVLAWLDFKKPFLAHFNHVSLIP